MRRVEIQGGGASLVSRGWSDWEVFPGGDDAAIAKVPLPIRMEYGTMLGQLVPAIAQRDGPLAVYASISRLCAQKLCTIEISQRRHRGTIQLRCRYRGNKMKEFVLLK